MEDATLALILWLSALVLIDVPQGGTKPPGRSQAR